MSTIIIKLELTEEQYEKAMIKVASENLPSIKKYLNLHLLNESNEYDYEDLLYQLEISIEKLNSGDVFIARDMMFETEWNSIPFENKKELDKIILYLSKGKQFPIKPVQKDDQGVQLYRKI